jgi:hypothetical protein
MNNPETALREYLNRLIHRFLNTKSLYLELKRIHEWQGPRRLEALQLGAYFFELATYSFSRTVLVEMAMLLSPTEQRSLIDWLTKAKEHVAALGPTRSSPSHFLSGREPIKAEEYCALIERHISCLDAQKDVIDRIKLRRDKTIVHLDIALFNSPKALDEVFPMRDAIDHLMNVVSDILKKHYSCLFEADLRMEYLSTRNVDLVLQYARAFQRARKDRTLIRKGFKPIDYMRDEYQENE